MLCVALDSVLRYSKPSHFDTGFKLVMSTYYAQNDDARLVDAVRKIKFELGADAPGSRPVAQRDARPQPDGLMTY